MLGKSGRNAKASVKFHRKEVVVSVGSTNNFKAVSAASVLNDRLCIASNGTNKKRISAEDLLTCCDFCPGKSNGTVNVCKKGGSVMKAAKYMARQGVVTGATNAPIGCKPTSEETFKGNAPPCIRKCTNLNHSIPYNNDKTFIKGARYEYDGNIEQIQLEILKHGPVTTSISILKDAEKILEDENFKGVFTGPNTTDTRPNHGVKIIGWGVEEGVPYWLIVNSWGDDWGGNKGLFKLHRGVNLLMCEGFVRGLKTEYEPDEKKDEDERYNSVLKTSAQLMVVLLNVACFQYLVV